jgi:aminoglycoside phosphotransferase (APT) family kinase protein
MKINKHMQVLNHLGISNSPPLGKGMEGHVYPYADDKVVKIWEIEFANQAYLQDRKQFYDRIAGKLSIPIPEIYKIGEYNDVVYTIEKRLSGESGSIVYSGLSPEMKNRLLDNYFNILLELKSVSMEGDFGQLLSSSGGKIQARSWTEFLALKLDETLRKIETKPDHDIKGICKLFEKFKREELRRIEPQPHKTLVHGDLFLENVLIEADLMISGILDFSSLSVVGDHLMDVAALCYFATVSDGIDQNVEDYLVQKVVVTYAIPLSAIQVYLVYYSLLFVNSKTYDPRTYSWCVNNLQRLGYL